MPEIWLPYLDVNVSFKVNSSQIEQVFEAVAADAPPQSLDAETYIGDGSLVTKTIAESRGLKAFEQGNVAPRESVIDGELIRFPAGLEKAILVCGVRVDQYFGFTGPHWLLAKALNLEDAFLKRSSLPWNLSEELEWFSKRVLEESGTKALCYFGNGSRAVFGKAHEVLSGIKGLLPRIRLARGKEAVIASAGGMPYDETFYNSLFGLYQSSLMVSDGGTLVYISGSKGGFGDDDALRYISGKAKPGALLDVVLRSTTGRGVSVYIVSGLPFSYMRSLGFLPFTTLQAAVDKALASAQKATVIKEASTIFVDKR